jgi:hypothetical protein
MRQSQVRRGLLALVCAGGATVVLAGCGASSTGETVGSTTVASLSSEVEPAADPRPPVASSALLADATQSGQPPPSASSASALPGAGERDDPSADDLAPDAPAFEPSDQVCAYDAAERIGTLTDERLIEVSGLGFSRLVPDLLWAHNDSGDGANLYGSGIDGGGGPAGGARIVTADDVFAIDWEDMSIVGEDGTPGDIYVGDIGDNRELRAFVFVYRATEPAVGAAPIAQGSGAAESVSVERFALAYPDGPQDAEALLVDPLDGDVFIITKGADGRDPVVYRAASAELTDGARVVMEAVATLEVDGQVTGADLSHNGDRVAVRTYEEVLVYPRIDDDLARTFAEEPCVFAGPDEPQGEAVAFDLDDGIVVVSEGSTPSVYRYAPQG